MTIRPVWPVCQSTVFISYDLVVTKKQTNHSVHFWNATKVMHCLVLTDQSASSDYSRLASFSASPRGHPLQSHLVISSAAKSGKEGEGYALVLPFTTSARFRRNWWVGNGLLFVFFSTNFMGKKETLFFNTESPGSARLGPRSNRTLTFRAGPQRSFCSWVRLKLLAGGSGSDHDHLIEPLHRNPARFALSCANDWRFDETKNISTLRASQAESNIHAKVSWFSTNWCTKVRKSSSTSGP